uniref:Protein kinase domain-containing protein n=1 Tax=Meloidogyne javanica TaxID=6303 RepID=A0A915MYR4_MELJA
MGNICTSELSEEGQEEYDDTELATTSHGGNARCNCGLYEVEELNKYIEIQSIGLHFKDETIGAGTFGKKHRRKMFAVLELGGPNLYDYYVNQEIYDSEDKSEIVENIARAAAIALNELHQRAVIHLDIKAENFVIALREDQRNLKVNPFSFKLIDFNTSVLVTDHVKANTASITKVIKAPEIRKNKKNYVNQKVDVWAFGIMIYGLLYNKLYAFKELNNVNAMNDKSRYNRLDSELNYYRSNHADTNLDNIINWCIQEDPDQRPSMYDIFNYL